MEDRYTRNAGAVFSLKYHLVFCPKYRRPVLVAPIDARLKVVLQEIAETHEMTLHSMEIMPDYVHLFVETDVRKAPARVASLLKGGSSNILRKEFPSLRARLPTLWSRSYFIASVGAVSEAAVRRYIEDQKGK